MRRQTISVRLIFLGTAVLFSTVGLPALGQDMRPQTGDVQAEDPSYPPYAGRNFPTEAATTCIATFCFAAMRRLGIR